MELKEVGLREILNFGELEKLFRSYSLTSGCDVVLYGLDGSEQLAVRRAESVCTALRGAPVCREKIVQSGKKAEELKTSYIYETPCGLIMCIAAVSLDMMNALDAREEDAEDIAAFAGQVEGVETAVTIRELRPGECKLSVRTSAGLNASAVCALLGGGGHAAAAGCSVAGSVADAKTAILNAIRQVQQS